MALVASTTRKKKKKCIVPLSLEVDNVQQSFRGVLGWGRGVDWSGILEARRRASRRFAMCSLLAKGCC